VETQHTFPLVGGPFDGQTNALLAAHAPEHLLIPVPTEGEDATATRVAVYLREQVAEGRGGSAYRYRYSETRALRPGETRK